MIRSLILLWASRLLLWASRLQVWPSSRPLIKGQPIGSRRAENRQRFVAAPEKFQPQYGGYCAFAIALNQIADIDPDKWAIVDNKLYLNNNFISQTLWSFDKTGNIARGDHNWPLVPKLGNQ